MSCNRGIYSVSKQQLNDFAAGSIQAITSVSYGKADGLLNTECNGNRQPAGWRAAEIRTIAIEAEGAGFDAIFTTEVNSDALATAQLMGEATERGKAQKRLLELGLVAALAKAAGFPQPLAALLGLAMLTVASAAIVERGLAERVEDWQGSSARPYVASTLVLVFTTIVRAMIGSAASSTYTWQLPL